MIDSATIVPTSLVTVHFKGLQQNEGKTEIEFHIMIGNGTIEHMVKSQMRRAYKSKDDRKQVKAKKQTGGHVLLCIKFILAKTHV